MIEKITYKTKLEELLDLNQIIEIINKFTQNFEESYTETNPNNIYVKRDIAVINNRIVDIAKEQRRKELEKLLQATSERLSEIDSQLYAVNDEIMKLKVNPHIDDREQREYEYEQLLNTVLSSKASLETKRKQIFEFLAEL